MVGRCSRVDRSATTGRRQMLADTNGDEEFVVERIVAQRKRGRRTEFLVAWKGYPPEENTWEPRSSLRKARDPLAEFEASQLAGA